MRYVVYLFLAVMILCCSDETKELSLAGQIKGNVYLYTEFGYAETDQSGATISVEGTDNKVVTGANGSFTMDVQTGTYNLVVEKAGYVKYTVKGVVITGGGEPLYRTFSLFRPITTLITNFTASYASGRILMTGKVTHSNPSSSPTVYEIVYFSTSPNVSSTNFERSVSFSLSTSSGFTFSNSLLASFPSGSKVYAIAYGTILFYLYNPDTDRYEYTNLGTPSNIVSMQIP